MTLIAQGTPRPAADLQCPLLSLPLALGTTFDTIPARTPYLDVPPAYGRKWRGSLGGQAKRKIGIAWSGRIQQNETRSMPLAALDPLFALDGIDWIVLQPDLSADERAALDAHPRAASIHRFDTRIGDFADTAAIIERLDAVVSVDTSVAHLAGALRKPLWLMLPFAADWRWFAGDTRSPWYPGATLVRQPRPGAWGEVVDAVAANCAKASAAALAEPAELRCARRPTKKPRVLRTRGFSRPDPQRCNALKPPDTDCATSGVRYSTSVAISPQIAATPRNRPGAALLPVV